MAPPRARLLQIEISTDPPELAGFYEPNIKPTNAFRFLVMQLIRTIL
jgi:hypothetical protein